MLKFKVMILYKKKITIQLYPQYSLYVKFKLNVYMITPPIVLI